MNDNDHRSLLPAGLGDMLPPEAALEARVVETLMACCAAHGYERVKPPLIEFEQSLLAGAGAGMASQTFRLMDPISQRMMGLRADMTLQVARIATTRLRDMPRPLRLSYAGQVLRVKGTQLRPERQFAQIGAELIGSDSAAADAEAVLLAATALKKAGVSELSIDLSLPTLVATLAEALRLEPALTGRVQHALERKDEAGLKAVLPPAHEAAALFVRLIRLAGPAGPAVAALRTLDLPQAARGEVDRLAEVVALLAAGDPALRLTVDPVEYRGFEYQTGVSFTLFAMNVRGELGRGGRYIAGDGITEPATGFTLYMDTVLQAASGHDPAPRLLVPVEAGWAARERWQAEGFVTVAALTPAADLQAEARRLGCSHALIGERPVAIVEKE